MTTTRPPGLESKSAPAMLAPSPSAPVPSSTALSGVTEVDGAGHVVALVAVTGIVDDVQDVIEPGAFRRTIKERRVRGVLGHDWNRPVAVADEVVELMPGDKRLPATAPDGTPWPPEAGALRVTARYLLGTKDGREAYEVAKAFGAEQGFSIGYRVRRARQRGRVRHIDDLELFEFSPVLHGANRLATLQSVKGRQPAGLERKAVPVPVRAAGGAVLPCGVCGRPAGAVVPGGLADGDVIVCPSCVAEVGDVTRVDGGTIPAAELAAADMLFGEPELTVEQEYAQALADELGYDLETDGTVTPAGQHSPARTGRAWTRQAPTSGWGRP